MTQRLITMTHKELSRYEVIKKLIDGRINGSEAAESLSLSVRHIRRLKRKNGNKEVEAFIHGNRGRESNRKIKKDVLDEVEKHLKEKYADFKPTFASEKLDEIHKIKLSSEKVRQIMTNLGLWKPKPRKQSKKWHVWRPRKDNFGEMQQFDGSYHHWLEKRAGELCLLASIDDATGKVTHAKFDYNESVVAVFKFWLEYFEKNGLPVSIYLDKFSTYKVNHKNATDNKELITQFERAMNQIGVKPITAHSAEAKGRVERLFQTFQDRLIKEMRLAGISTIEEANRFLEEYIPKFNAKFAVVPNRKTDLHKSINKQLKEKLPQIFSIQSKRIVHNDYTIMFKKQYFQLDKVQPAVVYKKDAVIIEEHLKGEVKINLKGHYLNYRVLPGKPKKQIDVKLLALTQREPSYYKPPANHPWRQPFIFGKKIKVEKKIDIAELVLSGRQNSDEN